MPNGQEKYHKFSEKIAQDVFLWFKNTNMISFCNITVHEIISDCITV